MSKSIHALPEGHGVVGVVRDLDPTSHVKVLLGGLSYGHHLAHSLSGKALIL
jgi:hypothetical protein